MAGRREGVSTNFFATRGGLKDNGPQKGVALLQGLSLLEQV